MSTLNIFKDALSFPIKEWKKWLILGVLMVILSIFKVLTSFGIITSSFLPPIIEAILALVIAIVFGFAIAGYKISIIKDTINNSTIMPSFNIRNDFFMGVKYVVLAIVYYIIPAIIIFVTAYLTNAFNYLHMLYSHYTMYGSVATSTLSTSADISLLIVIMVSLLVLVIFKILLIIATAVFAETGKLTSAMNMKNVIVKISEIGWKNYIIWLIIYLIAFIIMDLVISLVHLIPMFWSLIIPLFISSYFAIFISRAVGLLYSSSNN